MGQTLTDNASIYAVMERFPNERSAIEYLQSRRWPDGVVCPHCENKNIHQWPNPMYYECRECHKVFTVRTGTIFERSHVPLHKWMLAIYLMNTSRKGISSIQLGKALGVTQTTAWFMLQRLREACGISVEMLSGVIETDETYIGGLAKRGSDKFRGKGRGTANKQVLWGIRERYGKVALKVVPDITGETLGY